MPGHRPWTLLNLDISHGCLCTDPKQNKDSSQLEMDPENLDKDISRLGLGHLPGPGPRSGLKPVSYIYLQVPKSKCLCPNPGCQ